MKNTQGFIVHLYLLSSLVLAVFLLSVYLAAGSAGIDAVFKVGPASYGTINAFVICACWVLLGAVLVVWRGGARLEGRRFAAALFLLLAFSFLNVVREPHLARRGDFGVYWNAVRRVESGRPMPPGYVYPPLLTSILRPFYPLGSRETSNLFKVSNYGAVLLMYLLLLVLCRKYGFGPRSSALLPFALLVFGVPLSRAIAYQQVTIHVVNLILLSLLFCGRSDTLSAISLALAVNLKVTPAVLVLPFLAGKRWRWLAVFVLAQAAIIASTSWMCGPRYWADFFRQSVHLIAFAYRNNSIDSFLFNVMRFSGLPAGCGRALAAAVKIFFFFATLRMWKAACRWGAYYGAGDYLGKVYNGYIPLMLFMVLASPRMWAHYFIMLNLPFLVMLGRIRTGEELALYVGAYILIFLVPVFDLFPLSYHRLAGLLICEGLCWRCSKRPPGRGLRVPERIEGALDEAACAVKGAC